MELKLFFKITFRENVLISLFYLIIINIYMHVYHFKYCSYFILVMPGFYAVLFVSAASLQLSLHELCTLENKLLLLLYQGNTERERERERERWRERERSGSKKVKGLQPVPKTFEPR